MLVKRTDTARIVVGAAVALLCAGALTLTGCGAVLGLLTDVRPADRAFTSELVRTVPAAVGTSYTVEFTASDLAQYEGKYGMGGGWRRDTKAIARSVNNPTFAVYMTFRFDTDSRESARSQLDRQTAWAQVIESIPAERKASFLDMCAREWPYGPSVGGRHIEAIGPLKPPGPDNVIPMPAGVPWETGFRIGWGSDDGLMGGPGTIAWDPAAETWVSIK